MQHRSLFESRGILSVKQLTSLILLLFPGLLYAQPNILVVMVDDLGYADIGVHGGKDVPTPHIDALAAAGVRCTNGYVTAPYCSPSRAGFLTGKVQTRFGHEFNPHNGDEDKLGLPLDQRTIADVLGEAGYKTGLIGKWHEGFDKAHHPLSRGFDSFFGFLVGQHNFILKKDGKPQFGTAYSQNMIYRGRELEPQEGYCTDLFTKEALNFMNRQNGNPWFLYLSYNAVHTPLEILDEHRGRIPAHITDPARRGYLSLLLGLDDALGRIVANLKEKHPNTLMFFFSDNGGSGNPPFFATNTAVNKPLRGDKGQTYEGGIRVPFFVSWPGKLPAGKTYDHPVSTLDVLPTSCAIAKAKAPKGIEGVDLIPYLTGDNPQPPHAMLAWRFGPQKGIRQGHFKLVMARDFAAKKTGDWQLFDLSRDIGEQDDLAESKPDLVNQLKSAWERWNESNVPPLWPGTPNEDPKQSK